MYLLIHIRTRKVILYQNGRLVIPQSLTDIIVVLVLCSMEQ